MRQGLRGKLRSDTGPAREVESSSQGGHGQGVQVKLLARAGTWPAGHLLGACRGGSAACCAAGDGGGGCSTGSSDRHGAVAGEEG